MRKIIILPLFLLTCCTFDPAYKSLEIYNDSDSTMYVFYTYKDSITLQPKLDLFLNSGKDSYLKNNDSVISPDYRIHPRSFSYLRESSISRSQWIPFPDKDYVIFFFINESTMKCFSWENIVKHQLYQKKIRYTYKELQECHFSITYKP